MKLTDFKKVETLKDNIERIDGLMTKLKGYGSNTHLFGTFVDCYVPSTVQELRDFYKKMRARLVDELKSLGVTV